MSVTGEKLFTQMQPDMPVLFVNPLIVSSARRIPYSRKNGRARAMYGFDGEAFGMFTAKMPTSNLGFRIVQPTLQPFGFTLDAPFEQPLEGGDYHTVIYHEGKYKMWYEMMSSTTREDDDTVMMYAESDDGVNWTRICGDFTDNPAWHGSNAVYPSGGEEFFSGGIVFLDPCDREFPYKISYLSRDHSVTHPRLAYLWGCRDSNVNRNTHNCLRLAKSRDGLHWQPVPKPFMANIFPDAENTIYYHARLEKYLVFLRTRVFYARAFAHFQTADLRDLPADAYNARIFSEDPAYDIEGFNYMPYCHNDAVHLGFAIDHDYRYDSFFPQALYTSLNGVQWSRIASEGDGLMRPDRLTGEMNGLAYLSNGMVPFGDGAQVAVPASFLQVGHDFIAHASAKTEYHWAVWERDRIGYIYCADDREGVFSTINFEVPEGVELELNFHSGFTGEIQVQLADGSGRPIDGFRFGDCDFLNGNQRTARVSWQGRSRLPEFAQRQSEIREFNSAMEYDKTEVAGLMFQFRLRNTKLFAMTLRKA